MATEKRTMSTAAKVITALIYLLAIALLIGVIYLNLHTDNGKPTVREESDNKVTTVSSSQELPYNAEGSDKYAYMEPVYSVSDVSLQKDENGVITAFVNGAKAVDYTGVAKLDDGQWYFIRDGVFDEQYNGIAANEKGNWYIKNGRVDFTYNGPFQVNNTIYSVTGGKVDQE